MLIPISVHNMHWLLFAEDGWLSGGLSRCAYKHTNDAEQVHVMAVCMTSWQKLTQVSLASRDCYRCCLAALSA